MAEAVMGLRANAQSADYPDADALAASLVCLLPFDPARAQRAGIRINADSETLFSWAELVWKASIIHICWYIQRVPKYTSYAKFLILSAGPQSCPV